MLWNLEEFSVCSLQVKTLEGVDVTGFDIMDHPQVRCKPAPRSVCLQALEIELILTERPRS